jgi:protein-disulfide isomerase
MAGGKRTRAAERQIVEGESIAGYVFVLSTAGLAFSMYLAWASFFQLRALCVLCVLTYVAVLGLFIVSARAQSVPAGELPGRAVSDGVALLKKPLTLAMIVVLAAAAAFALISFPRDSAPGAVASNGDTPIHGLSDGQRAQFEAWYKLQPVVDVPIDRGTAKVLIVKFNDYQCPPCRQTYEQYKSILAKHTAAGDVKYVIKHFPLELECNTKNANHAAACEAAAAVLMAEEKGTGPKLEQWLFANQGPPLLTPDQIRRAVDVVGEVKDFDARYKEMLTRISADAALGVKLGVESTPTFFINGRRILGGLPPAAFEEAIQLELKRP